MEVNAIYEGNNIEIMSQFPDESVDLIYLDPPFFSNRFYEVIWDDGAEIRCFEDRWKGGVEHYIKWMEGKIRACHKLLKSDGSLFLHCDWHANSHLRILLDKIFGEKKFRAEIVWHYVGGGWSKKNWSKKHDTILFYSKSDNFNFNVDAVRVPYDKKTIERNQYVLAGKIRGINPLGRLPDDVWEIPVLRQNAKERLGYPTQKPLALLERIVKASSNKGEIVLDPFCGCGTTIAAAQKLGRKWIGIDVSPTACKLMKDRMHKKFGVNAKLIRGSYDFSYVSSLSPKEFQNWVVVEKFFGAVSGKMSGDMGIDGITSPLSGSLPIQVKQSRNVGRNVVDNFETAVRRLGKKRGFIVAYSFSKGAYEEAARVKNKEGLDIDLFSIRELLAAKSYQELLE